MLSFKSEIYWIKCLDDFCAHCSIWCPRGGELCHKKESWLYFLSFTQFSQTLQHILHLHYSQSVSVDLAINVFVELTSIKWNCWHIEKFMWSNIDSKISLGCFATWIVLTLECKKASFVVSVLFHKTKLRWLDFQAYFAQKGILT